MKRILCFLLGTLAVMTLDCGKNQSILSPDGSISPPQNLKAFSLNKQAVRLEWTAPLGVSDSSFGGYFVQRGTRQDTLAKGALNFTADSLASAVVTFTMYSYSVSGKVSSPVGIRWAPAERFPNPYTIYENRGVSSAGDPAIDAGTGGGTPVTMPLDNNALGKADFFLYGGSGQLQGPLLLQSADQYVGNFKATLFSTVTHSSTTLDYPLSAFPSSSTFTEKSIAVNVNTIYYAQLSGSGSDVYFARILLASLGGSFPGRSIVLRISLQRLVNTPFADAMPWGASNRLQAAVLPFLH